MCSIHLTLTVLNVFLHGFNIDFLIISHPGPRVWLLRKSQLKCMLVYKNFLTRLPIGWRLCNQPIRDHDRKFDLANIHFNMDFFSNQGHKKHKYIFVFPIDLLRLYHIILHNSFVWHMYIFFMTHCSDVTRMALHIKSPTFLLFVLYLFRVDIKENIKTPHHWPFAWGIHQWIPLTKGQECGKRLWRHHAAQTNVIYRRNRFYRLLWDSRVWELTIQCFLFRITYAMATSRDGYDSSGHMS